MSYPNDGTCFGGSLHKSHPKVRRPYHHWQALHVVLRSGVARGKLSMIHAERRRKIRDIVLKQARRFGVRVYGSANAGNHLHLMVLPPRSRADFAGFTRAVSGLVARATLGAERGAAKGIKFWERRPFTRIVPAGPRFRACRRYIGANTVEAVGFGEAEDLDRILAHLNRWRPRRRVPH